MSDFSQGDIIKIAGFKYRFLIISTNAFIRATGAFHVCPIMDQVPEGPLHIYVEGKQGTKGTVICEQIKLIDPSARNCSRLDRISYNSLLNISDAIQSIFEYD